MKKIILITIGVSLLLGMLILSLSQAGTKAMLTDSVRLAEDSVQISLDSSSWVPYANKYAVIVMGGPSSGQLYEYYWIDTYGMYKELRDFYGFTDENIYFLSWGYQADAHPEVVDYESSKANVQLVFSKIQAKSTDDDLVYVFLVDHGNAQSFQLPGGSITHAEYNDCIKNISAKIIIGAYNPCYSGAVINDVSRAGVISITSVSDNQPNSFGWAGTWRTALKGGTKAEPCDANGDGHISMTEAYEWMAPRSQAYSPPEHPWFDDNGDAVGNEYSTSGYAPNEPDKDGYIGKFYSLSGWSNY